MAVTAKNVLVGIGDFLIDSVSMGSTRGGVTVTKDIEIYEKIIDQELSPVGASKVRETYTISTNIAETDLAKLKVLWDIPSSVENAGTANETLSWGTTTTVDYKELQFKGKSPEGNDRTFTVYKALLSEVGDTVLAKDDIAVVPVTFTAFADTGKPVTQRIGQIVDDNS